MVEKMTIPSVLAYLTIIILVLAMLHYCAQLASG